MEFCLKITSAELVVLKFHRIMTWLPSAFSAVREIMPMKLGPTNAVADKKKSSRFGIPRTLLTVRESAFSGFWISPLGESVSLDKSSKDGFVTSLPPPPRLGMDKLCPWKIWMTPMETESFFLFWKTKSCSFGKEGAEVNKGFEMLLSCKKGLLLIF